MAIMKLEKGVEPGEHKAVLERIEEHEMKYGPSLKFIYRLANNQELNELVSKIYSPKSKLGARVQTLKGELPEEMDWNQLIGIPVVLIVEKREDSDFCKISAVKKQEV